MKRSSATRERSRPDVVTAVVVVATLYFARVVFIPLALALLLTILLTPLIELLERIKLPRIMAIAVVVIFMFSFTGLVGWKASQQFVVVTNQLPMYKKTLEDKIQALKGSQPEGLNRASDTMKELGKEIVTTTPGSPQTAETKSPLLDLRRPVQ